MIRSDGNEFLVSAETEKMPGHTEARPGPTCYLLCYLARGKLKPLVIRKNLRAKSIQMLAATYMTDGAKGVTRRHVVFEARPRRKVGGDVELI